MGDVSWNQWGIQDELRPWDERLPYGQRMQPTEITAEGLNAMIVASSGHDKTFWV